MTDLNNTSGVNSEFDTITACSICGAELSDGQDFCPKCGNPRNRKLVCKKCNIELREGQLFCPKCGKKAETSSITDDIVQQDVERINPDGKRKKRKKTKVVLGIIVGMVVLAVAIFALWFFKGGLLNPKHSGITVSQIENALSLDSKKVKFSISDNDGSFSYSEKTLFIPQDISGTVDKKGEVDFIRFSFNEEFPVDKISEQLVVRMLISRDDLSLIEIDALSCMLMVVKFATVIDPDLSENEAYIDLWDEVVDLFSLGTQMQIKDWTFTSDVSSTTECVVVSARFSSN